MNSALSGSPWSVSQSAKTRRGVSSSGCSRMSARKLSAFTVSLPPQKEVEGEATADVRPGRAQVGEEGIGVAAGLLRGVRQHGEVVEGAAFIRGPSRGDRIGCQPTRGGHDRPERVADDVPQQLRLLGMFPLTDGLPITLRVPTRLPDECLDR